MRELVTDRLLIRKFREIDGEDLYEYLSDEEVVKFEPYKTFSREKAYDEAKRRIEDNNFLAVCLENGKLIGNLYFEKGSFGTYKVGYVFNRNYWGNGYATESLKALIKYAFEELGVRRIIAKCDPKNHNSWKLLERVGMRREGTLLQNVYFFTDENNNPIWKDTYEYAVLKDEYKAENIKHNIEEKMQYKITSIPSENDKKEIYEELLKYNLAHIENKDVKELGIFLENEEGKKVAGLIGDTHGNWLTIDYLWVDENLRGKDIGREIIKKAEIEARNRGCKYSFLNTFEFQAEGFYLKLGYKKVFSLEEYPVTGKRHYLIKKL